MAFLFKQKTKTPSELTKIIKENISKFDNVEKKNNEKVIDNSKSHTVPRRNFKVSWNNESDIVR
jgi:cystathionine beta-lyase family protein involved in aluminum resistance